MSAVNIYQKLYIASYCGMSFRNYSLSSEVKGLVKVGITQDPCHRLLTLWSPFNNQKLSYWGVFEIPNGSAFELEQSILANYKKSGLRLGSGCRHEWIMADPLDIIETELFRESGARFIENPLFYKRYPVAALGVERCSLNSHEFLRRQMEKLMDEWLIESSVERKAIQKNLERQLSEFPYIFKSKTI